MLYHLLYPLHEIYGWLNVFRYLTFRAMLAFFIAFIIVLIGQPFFIRKLKSFGVRGQPIRNDGPKDHAGKSGTPTMGGMMIILAVLVATLLCADLTNIYVWLTLAVMLALATVGFLDDWAKITKQSSSGLSEKKKLLSQSAIGGVAVIALYSLGASTELVVPFLKDATINLGMFYLIFSLLVIVGASNAVNLTDGLDGLAIGPVMTVAATYAIFTYLSGHAELSKYLGIFALPGAGEVTIILSAMVAAGLGFLWYNAFPAQVFMGDVGALALGGVLGFVSVMVKQELILALAGGVFVIETMSVIIQRYYFKLTGKRVFKMAPIHHHFELHGWAEPKIIVRFWIISIVLALLALTSLKLR